LLSAITEFPLPTAGLNPGELTVGPDGDLWFPMSSLSAVPGAIGRITPSGALTEFPLPTAGSSPISLTVGPDGNLWFTEGSAAGTAIGRITPAGAITQFPLPAGDSSPYGLMVGPDGNLWFAEAEKIGRITLSGALTEFPLPAGDSYPDGLTVGPDGNLWFLENFPGTFGYSLTSKIARITPFGALTEFPAGGGFVGDLMVGPDGNLWFTDNDPSPDFPRYSSGAIDRVTPAGALTVFELPTAGISLSSLSVGPDGNLWFTESGVSSTVPGAIGRITPAGHITEFPLPTADSNPSSLTVGPDGNLWFVVTPSIGQPLVIGRIRLAVSGAITEVQLSHLSPPAGSVSPPKLTVGPDGNLWFAESNPGRIEKIGLDAFPPPPSVTGVLAVAHSSKAISSILLGFDEALDPASGSKGRFYSLAVGVKKGQTIVFSKRVKIARVSYDSTAHTVRLKLAVPQKRPVQVTVSAGLVAADGMSSFNDFTAVVT
jgi:streptogramin lyase